MLCAFGAFGLSSAGELTCPQLTDPGGAHGEICVVGFDNSGFASISAMKTRRLLA